MPAPRFPTVPGIGHTGRLRDEDTMPLDAAERISMLETMLLIRPGTAWLMLYTSGTCSVSALR